MDLLTRRRLRRLCRMFRRLTLTTRHLGLEIQPRRPGDGWARALVKNVYWRTQQRLERRFGWYLIAVAKK